MTEIYVSFPGYEDSKFWQVSKRAANTTTKTIVIFFTGDKKKKNSLKNHNHELLANQLTTSSILGVRVVSRKWKK
jgi:hypothetical protein